MHRQLVLEVITLRIHLTDKLLQEGATQTLSRAFLLINVYYAIESIIMMQEQRISIREISRNC